MNAKSKSKITLNSQKLNPTKNCKKLFRKPNTQNHGDHHQTNFAARQALAQKTNHKISDKLIGMLNDLKRRNTRKRFSAIKALSTFKKPSRNKGKEPQVSLEIQGYCEYTFILSDIGKQPWNTIKQGIYFM